MWALSGFSLSNVSRKLSNLSNPSTATSSVYSNGGMGAYRDAKEVRANTNTRQLSMETVFEEVFGDEKKREETRGKKN